MKYEKTKKDLKNLTHTYWIHHSHGWLQEKLKIKKEFFIEGSLTLGFFENFLSRLKSNTLYDPTNSRGYGLHLTNPGLGQRWWHIGTRLMIRNDTESKEGTLYSYTYRGDGISQQYF